MPGSVQRGHRRILAAGCTAALASALVTVIIVDGHNDDTSQMVAPPPSAASSPVADTGPYLPSGASAADLTSSPTTHTAEPTKPAGASTTIGAASTTGAQGIITNPVEVGAPTNITHIAQVNGRFPYTLGTIDKASPEQVAWAYTTLRYTVTWTDADSQQATTRAAKYAAPTLPPRTGMTPPTEWQPAADAQWQQAVKAQVLSTVQITSLTVQLGAATPGRFTLVTVSWVTTTSRNDQPTITVPGTNTLNLAAQADGTWLVAGTGADQPS